LASQRDEENRRGSDRSDVNPESSVIRLILDPLNRVTVEVDVFSVGILQARSTIAMSSEPPFVAVVVLAVPTRGDISIKVRAVSYLIDDHRCWLADFDLLQLSAIVPFFFALSFESSARGANAQHAPVYLE
jgi:hypothetical protein